MELTGRRRPADRAAGPGRALVGAELQRTALDNEVFTTMPSANGRSDKTFCPCPILIAHEVRTNHTAERVSRFDRDM